VFFGVTAAAALTGQLGCGSFIVRHGALRMSQVALVMLAVAMAAMRWLAKHVHRLRHPGGMARRCPRRRVRTCWAGFAAEAGAAGVFPEADGGAGGSSAGRHAGTGDFGCGGWRAPCCGGAGAAAFAVALQPLRERFDDDRVPTQLFRISDFGRTLKS